MSPWQTRTRNDDHAVRLQPQKRRGSMSKEKKVALLWRGDREMRDASPSQGNRLYRIFDELRALGVAPEPCVFDESFIDEVRAQLKDVDGVLVFVDPLSNGKTRKELDPLLREIAARGVLVSTHPDVILRIGTKQVLYDTRKLGWGADTRLYRTVETFRHDFPETLRSSGPRVLKQHRGNGGQGVWKVELESDQSAETVRVLHAQRGSVPEALALGTFMQRCETYFENDGLIVDQPFQARLADGMIRCYMSGDRVVGFGHQLIKALIPPPPEGPDSPQAQPGPRIMHGPDAPQFQALRTRMEAEWVPQLMDALEIEKNSMPLLWDADFLYGPRDSSGADTYVLCEINVSAIFPYPDSAPASVAKLMKERLEAADTSD